MSSLDYAIPAKGPGAYTLFGGPFSATDTDLWGAILSDANVNAQAVHSMYKLAQRVVSSATALEPGAGAVRSRAPYRWYAGASTASAAASLVTKPDEWDSSVSHLWRAVRGEVELDVDEVAPGALTVKAIERLIPAFRTYRVPDFGFNDDGSVALRWADPVRPRSFALHFGEKRVSAVFSEPLEGPGFAESFLLANAEALLPVMTRLKIADLIKG